MLLLTLLTAAVEEKAAEEKIDKLQQLLEKLMDWGVNAGGHILGALIIFIVGRFAISFLNKMLARILNRRRVDAGVQSFVKRADNVDVIESSALPIGIVEEATPYSDSRLLSGTDSVVLVSDGIVDALGADGVRLVLSRTDTLSPQELCDTLLAKATEYGAKDDSTAVAVRLIAG